MLRALGAEAIVCPTNVSADDAPIIRLQKISD